MSRKKVDKLTAHRVFHERQRVRGIQTLVADPTYSKTFVSVSSYRSMKHGIGNESKGNSTCTSRRNSQEKVNNFHSIEASLQQQEIRMPQNRREKFPAPPAFEELSGLDLSHLSSEERAAILQVAARAKQIEQVETRRVKTIEKQVEDFSRPKHRASPQRSVSGNLPSKPQRSTQQAQPYPVKTTPEKQNSQIKHAASNKPNKDVATPLQKSKVPPAAKQQVGNVATKKATDDVQNVKHRCSFCNEPLAANLEGQSSSSETLQSLKRCTSCGRDVCKSCVVLSTVLAKKGEVLCKLCNKQRELAAKSNVWLRKRPLSQLHRSASADTPEIGLAQNEGKEKGITFSEQASRRRSYSADTSHTGKDSKKRTQMSLPEALVRQLSVEKGNHKTKPNKHVQEAEAHPSSKSSQKPRSEKTQNAKVDHRPPHKPHSAAQDPLSKNIATKTESNSSQMSKTKASTEHISKTKPEQSKGAEKATISHNTAAEVKKTHVNFKESHQSPPKVSSTAQESPPARTEPIRKPKDEASSVLEKLKRQFPLQQTKPDLARKDSQPTQSFTTNQEKPPINSVGITQSKKEIQVAKHSTEEVMKPTPSEAIAKPSESITKSLASTTHPQKSTNTPLEATVEPIKATTNGIPPAKVEGKTLEKQNFHSAKPNEKPPTTKEKAVEDMQHRNKIKPKDTDKETKRKDVVNDQDKKISNFEEWDYERGDAHHLSDNIHNNSKGRAESAETFEPLYDYTLSGEHPLAKQNVPSAYVARRSSIEETTRTMPNATSICSSLAESEGPAEWSVDELDDNDTFFLVTSSSGDKTNLPSGITKPSDLRSAVEGNELRMKEAQGEGLSDESNYDFVSYEDDTEGDFDQFLKDEEEALIGYTGSLKRVSLFNDLSSMASSNEDNSHEDLNKSDSNTLSKLPPEETTNKVEPNETDLPKGQPKTGEGHRKLKRTDSITNQVQSTISMFESQTPPRPTTERSKTKFPAENSPAGDKQQVTADSRFDKTDSVEKPAGFSMVKSQAVSNFYAHNDKQKLNASTDRIQSSSQNAQNRPINHTRDAKTAMDTSETKHNKGLQSNANDITKTPITKPIPAKRKTSTIPAITVTNEADTKFPDKQNKNKVTKASKPAISTFSELDQVSGDKKQATSVDSARSRLNRSPISTPTSVYVNKFGSKVLQPANTSKLPISPLVTSSNSVNDLSSSEGETQQRSSSKKIWAVHKAGYFDSDSESGEDADDDDEKELLKFTSSVPIHPEEMEEYDSAKVVPSASPSSRMFFRRTTSTDNFEDLLKRATETPRTRKSGTTARIDKIASRFAKKSDDGDSSIARSVSLSPPNGANSKTESSSILSSRRMSEPLICQTDRVLKPEPSHLSLSPSRGSFSSLPSPNSLGSSTEKKDLVVNMGSTKDFGVSTHMQSDIFSDSGHYSSMVRCVSCGVLSNSSASEPKTHIANQVNEVKIEPPKSLEMNQARTKKCQSVSSSTQVTPDQPPSGFSFLPSVDLCQLTALIEALKNVQGLGTSAGELEKHNTTSSVAYEPRSVLYKDASTETSLTGEPIILLKDRVLECGRYREVESSVLSPRRRPNTTHACVGTQDSVVVKRESQNWHRQATDERREPSKYGLPIDEYSLRHDHLESHPPYPYPDHELGDAYCRNSHYPSHDIYEHAYSTARQRPRCSRETYSRYSRYADQDRYLPQHFSSFPFDQSSEYDRNPRSHYHRPRAPLRCKGGEFNQAMSGSRKHLPSRDPYCSDAYQQDYLNEISMPENFELEVQPPALTARRQVTDGYNNMMGSLATLPNDDFSLKRSASVPAVARQDILSQGHMAQPMHQNAGVDVNAGGEVGVHRNVQPPGGVQYSRPALTNQVVSAAYAPSTQYCENQDFYGRASQGSSYTLASLDGITASEFSNEESDETHRSPSKRTLPQPPEDDEFRWRYNNNKRFNTLTSGRSRNNYNRDYNTESTPRGSTRLRQTMEDLDQEEKELDLRLRYLELGRQTRSTSQSSLSANLYQANVSSTPLRTEYESDALPSSNNEPVPLTPSSRQASVLNISEASQSKAQRNYVIVDDVTQIVTSGPQPPTEVRNQKRNSQVTAASTRSDGHHRRNDATHRYRGDNSRVNSGAYQGDYSSSYRVAGTTNQRSANQHQTQSRITSNNQGNATYHARYALQDSEELERAFALSQNNYITSKMTSGKVKGQFTENKQTALNEVYDDVEYRTTENDYNYMSPIHHSGPCNEAYNTPQSQAQEKAERQYLDRQVNAVTIESQIAPSVDRPREEDMRTVVSDTEAYILRQELNDWFDKPRDRSRGHRNDSKYAEFSNDQIPDNC